MCGIAGFTVNSQCGGNLSDTLSAMVKAMRHRGPDALGYFTDANVCLGHARLSIIDLSEASNQPMYSTDNRYVVVYNGELYNFHELKLELQRVSQGSGSVPYFFKTNSDTEVVLAAYQKWGSDCLLRFNGMYAFAIYDKQENSLFIARDRLGIKPLYYQFKNKQLVFGSEIRSLLASGLVERKLNKSALNEYFQYQTVHAPRTLINQVEMLMPGTFLMFKNGDLKHFKYWSPENHIQKGNTDDYKTTCSKINEHLFRAVERRLVADVPFGAFLSGGIDSSAVVGIMSKLMSRKVETFNVSFDESEFSESKYAQKIASLFNTNHHEIKLTPNDFLKKLPEALAATDHPSGDGPNTYIVSQATKNAGITMALSGLGGDELFAGYDVFRRMHAVRGRAYLNLFPSWMRSIPASIIKSRKKSVAGDKMAEALSAEKINVKEIYPLTRKVFSDSIERKLFGTKGYRLHDIITSVNEPDREHLLSYVSVLEMKSYMQNVLLRDTDQFSMAVALEVRVPFLDYQLVEYALSVNDEFKFPSTPKKLLTDSLKGMLPEDIVNRPKMGFTLPWEHWIKNELKSFCEKNMMSLSQRKYADEVVLMDLWNQFLQGNTRITWSRIWHLVVLENWIQENKIQ